MLFVVHVALIIYSPISLLAVYWCTDAFSTLVLDDFEPSVSILLSYPSKHKSVTLGNSIKPKHVKSKPTFNIYATEMTPSRTVKSNATYVLALTDPDATSHSNPIKAQMCHWIATNITVSSSASVTLDDLELPSSGLFDRQSGPYELVEYFPPTPPPKTGYHRYVFVVLASHSSTDPELKKPKDRPHWGYDRIGAGIREWAEENSLVVVGE